MSSILKNLRTRQLWQSSDYKFLCPQQGCNWWFMRKSGFTTHLQSSIHAADPLPPFNNYSSSGSNSHNMDNCSSSNRSNFSDAEIHVDLGLNSQASPSRSVYIVHQFWPYVSQILFAFSDWMLILSKALISPMLGMMLTGARLKMNSQKLIYFMTRMSGTGMKRLTMPILTF